MVLQLLRLSWQYSCVVIAAKGKHFSAGLDLTDVRVMGETDVHDPARCAVIIQRQVEKMQASFTAIAECSKPVIAAIHGGCIGGAGLIFLLQLVSLLFFHYCMPC